MQNLITTTSTGSLCSGRTTLDSGIDYFLDDTDAATSNNLEWKITCDCIRNNFYSTCIKGDITMNNITAFGMEIQDLPDSYVIIAEKHDGTFEILTKKLTIREARNHLEIFNMHIRKEEFENIKKAFIFNLKEVA